jgi:acetyltransferase
VTLRPIGPRDAGVLQAYVRGLSQESRYNRFFGALHELPPAELDHVIHLAGQSQMALLAGAVVDSALIVIGEARYALSPDGLEGEFALSLADDWRGVGSARCSSLTSNAESEPSARAISAVMYCAPTSP